MAALLSNAGLDDAAASAPAARADFAPRPRTNVAKVVAYSRIVLGLRVVLPLLALGVLAFLVLGPLLQPREKIVLPAELPKATMEQPHYSGRDREGRPYEIWANQAQQMPGRETLIDLVMPGGQVELPNMQVQLQAQQGRFDQAAQRLWLAGQVHLQNSNGQQLKSEELLVAIATQTIWSERPTRISGPFGEVSGRAFRAYDGGQVVQFLGPARALLLPDGLAKALPAMPSSLQEKRP